MRKSVQYQLTAPSRFVDQFLSWSRKTEPVCLLNRNGFTAQNKAVSSGNSSTHFDVLAGAGAIDELILKSDENGFEELQKISNKQDDWLLGYLTYDLKNHVERLTSENYDGINLPLLHFFVPRYLLVLNENRLEIKFREDFDTVESVGKIMDEILHEKVDLNYDTGNVKVHQRIQREEYLSKVSQLKDHIQRGDIYEVNFCQEFYAEQVNIEPERLYTALNAKSPAPFSAYYSDKGKFLMCSSPERYLKKVGQKIFSQPIKGTAARGNTKTEDEALRDSLANDPKERSENVMIVDLVRNDLSRTAVRNSVKVEELLGVYTFPQVHQLISTVSCELRPDLHFVEAMKNSFPMGSMTGAPKIRAMELIEQYEESKRGLFSGAVGYINPGKDFDFNVVIRSMLFNANKKYLSITVGGAITNLSEPEKEYEECMLKAAAMLRLFDKTIQGKN